MYKNRYDGETKIEIIRIDKQKYNKYVSIDKYMNSGGYIQIDKDIEIDTYRKTKKYQQKWIPSDKDRNK